MNINITRSETYCVPPEILNGINLLLEKCLSEHPFIYKLKQLPQSVNIEAIITLDDVTSINHLSFANNQTVTLYIHDSALRGSNDDYIQNPLLRKIVFHEYGHFIDARLDTSFNYIELTEKKLYGHVQHLWNCFIDGRLGVGSPSTLEQRVQEGEKALKLASRYSIDAWNGCYSTYPHILETSKIIMA
jgi:hypothetical protein